MVIYEEHLPFVRSACEEHLKNKFVQIFLSIFVYEGCLWWSFVRRIYEERFEKQVSSNFPFHFCWWWPFMMVVYEQRLWGPFVRNACEEHLKNKFVQIFLSIFVYDGRLQRAFMRSVCEKRIWGVFAGVKLVDCHRKGVKNCRVEWYLVG